MLYEDELEDSYDLSSKFSALKISSPVALTSSFGYYGVLSLNVVLLSRPSALVIYFFNLSGGVVSLPSTANERVFFPINLVLSFFGELSSIAAGNLVKVRDLSGEPGGIIVD